MDARLIAGEAGVEIEVSIYVANDYDEADSFDGVWRAELYTREQGRNRVKMAVPQGSLRCTFVLELMMANLSSFSRISAELASSMESAMRDSNSFSQLDVRAERETSGDPTATHAFGQFMNAVFGSSRHYSSEGARCGSEISASNRSFGPFPVGCTNMKFDSTMRELGAVHSAITTTQTTRTLSFTGDGFVGVQTSTEMWWKWLAYALFSKRAKEFSSVESLALFAVRDLSIDHVDAFAAVLASEHPEETLFGTCRGQVDEQDAELRGCQLRFESDEQGDFTSNELTLSSTTPYVARTFSDDGISEWVNVVVPGFGRCQVRRHQLSFTSAKLLSRESRITSLTIEVGGLDDSNFEGIQLLLQTVGFSLRFLTIKAAGAEDLDLNAVLRSCPNIQELSLEPGKLKLRLDFHEFRKRKKQLPVIPEEWDETVAMIKILSGVSNPFVRCVHRLRVHALNYSENEDVEPLDVDSVLKGNAGCKPVVGIPRRYCFDRVSALPRRLQKASPAADFPVPRLPTSKQARLYERSATQSFATKKAHQGSERKL